MISTSLPEPGRVDEPQQAGDYAAVLSQVAAKRQPLIVCRSGFERLARTSPPPKSWLEGDEPKPF